MARSASEILRYAQGLAVPKQRPETAAALARTLGGEALFLFAPDPELGVLLPAPGLSQVLRGANQWRDFLGACAREGRLSGTVPGPDGEPVPARGLALPDGTAAVLTRPTAQGAGPEPLEPLLPLLGALFRAERQVAADVVRARAAAETVQRAHVLNRALQQMRTRLEAALAEAQDARMEARRRAEQAEALAAEHQVQAEALQEQAVELEVLNTELLARTEDAERARAAADEANHSKSVFLANMSHELRTPINAVIGYAELIGLGISGPVTEGQQAYLERIRASSAHLLTLVNDVLDLAKTEAGRLSVERDREPILPVVTEALALVEVDAAARRLVLENRCAAEPGMYVGDRARVRQILVNLFSNAVKFTEPGGRVTVRDGTTSDPDPEAEVMGEGPWLYVTVEDTGIGMDAEQLARVFHPFVQAEVGHTRTRGGTGLGLTISRQLARLMGGDLTVRSESGSGSTFTLWLPAASAEEGTLDPSIRVGARSGGEAYPAGTAEVGGALQEAAGSIVDRFVRRVRAELLDEAVEPMDRSEIVDNVPVLIAEIASVLQHLARMGDPALLRYGSDVQRLVAEKHGVERARCGWTARHLRLEFDILGEELSSAARAGLADAPGVDVGGALRLLDRLVEAARRTSLRSFGSGDAVAGESEPR